MKLSIVTIALNNSGGLKRTLLSLLPLKEKLGADLQIIVVDSSPEAHQSVREETPSWVDNWLTTPPAGIYSALNFGSSQATGKLLWHLHASDCLGSVPHLIQALETLEHSPESHLLFSPVTHVSSNGPPRLIPFRFNFRSNFIFASCPVHLGMIFKRNALEALGPFREDLKIAGDADLFIRAINSGWKCLYFPKPFTEFDTSGVSHQQPELACKEFRSVLRGLNTSPLERICMNILIQCRHLRISKVTPILKKLYIYRPIHFAIELFKDWFYRVR